MLFRKPKNNINALARSSDRVPRSGRSLANSICEKETLRTRGNYSRAPCKVLRNGNVRGVDTISDCLLKDHPSTDLKTISRFAQLEYKLGDPERGKTLFEGIIDSHPKRLDFWSVYMDMEAGQKQIQSLRSVVVEYVCTSAFMYLVTEIYLTESSHKK